MKNKRIMFAAGMALAAVLAYMPVEQVYALPQNTTTTVTDAAIDTTTETQGYTDVPVLQTLASTYNSVTISWTPVEGATKYKLQVGTNKKELKTVATIKTGKTLRRTVKNLYSAKKYYFRVIATCPGSDAKTSEWFVVKPMVAQPDGIALEDLGFGSVRLSWDALEGADEYRVYRSLTEVGGYTRIATISETAYTDTVTTGQTYYYKVVGVRINPSGKKVRGVVSDAQVIEVATDVPQMTSSKSTASSTTIHWSSVEGAEEYAIYRSSKKNSGYKKIASVTNTWWSDTSVETGTRYYYKVAAGHTVSGKMKYGTRSAALVLWTAPAAVQDLTAKQSAGGIKLSWSAAKGAKSYKIYRSADAGASYTVIQTDVTNTTYTDADISAGADYVYYVVAARDTLTSAKSATASAHIETISLNTRTLILGPGVTGVITETSSLPGEVTYASANKSIATVDASGTVTGVAPGKTTIHVRVGVVSADVTVTVTTCQVNGIDVSKWQGAIDWETVKASGVKFAMIRLAHGTSKDIQFENYYAGATAQDIPVGIYCYTAATSVASGKKEAQNLLDMLDGKDLDYPIALDLEDNTQLTSMNKEQRTKLVIAYKNIIENAGYEFVLYANLNWLNNYIDQSVLEENDVDIWIARYCSQSLGHRYTGGGNVLMWQYSSTGQIDGILDAYGRYINVDLDVYYGDY